MRALKIRLKRAKGSGCSRPFYNVIISFKDEAAKSGKSFEKLGFYAPGTRTFPAAAYINIKRTAK